MSEPAEPDATFKLTWDKNRLSISISRGGSVVHSDTLDPRSDISRKRVITKIANLLPNLDCDDLNRKLIEAGEKGPPEACDRSAAGGATVAMFANPEPAGEAVCGAQLLDDLTDIFRRYVVLPPYAAEISALWCVHTFVFDVFEYTPRLLITSPSMRCGKSRLLRIIDALVSRPLKCEGITGAALFRTIEKFRTTMMIDEGDTLFAKKDGDEVLRGVLNAGHQRGGQIVRCVGDDNEPKTFDVFAPVAIAMIGHPPNTVEDRGIPIVMRRRTPGEKTERFEPGRSIREVLLSHVCRCVRWTQDHRADLGKARPEVPAGLDDRAADCWYTLLAIADAAGGRWPQLARQAAVSTMSSRQKSEGTSVELLHDIKGLFDNHNEECMTTAKILSLLAAMEERPWPELNHGKPISARQLAGHLRAFEIHSRNLRQPSGTVAKGYCRADFEDAWGRYFPKPTPGTSATALQGFADNELRQNPTATGTTGVADAKERNPLVDQVRSAVADVGGGLLDENATAVDGDNAQRVTVSLPPPCRYQIEGGDRG